MRKRLSIFGSDTMVLAVALWMCTLPLLALIVLPLFGLKIAAVAAIVLFLAMLLICWGICGWRVFHD